jgi:ABC-type bacteriocin/lantibiotic exporter with double-glycine peptidase domain
VALIDAHRRRERAVARRSLGAATSIMAGEVEPIGGFAAEALNTPLIQGGTLLGVVGFMAVTEPILAAVGFAALGAEAILTPIMQHWINVLTYRRIRTLRRASRDLIEASEAGEDGHLVDSLREIRLSYRLRMRMNLLKSLLKVLRNVIEHLAEIAILGIGAAMAMAGETQIGVIVAFLSGLRRVRAPWSELVSFYRRFVDARVKYRLVHSVIRQDRPPAIPEKAPPQRRSTQTSR